MEHFTNNIAHLRQGDVISKIVIDMDHETKHSGKYHVYLDGFLLCEGIKPKGRFFKSNVCNVTIFRDSPEIVITEENEQTVEYTSILVTVIRAI